MVQPPVEAQAGFWDRAKERGMQGVAILVATGALALGACSGDKEPTDTVPTSRKDAVEQCDKFEGADAAANGSKYLSEAFLPKGKVENNKQAMEYIHELFDKNGPLAGEGDIASLAAIMAAVVEPANDGVVTDINYDYFATFQNRIAAYQGKDGQDAAAKDCKTAWDTLTQVAEYDGNWAQKGEEVTEFVAVRDVENEDEALQNRIIGMNFSKGATNETLKGIALELRGTSKELDGFVEVLITEDGRIFVKGITAGEGGNVTNNGETPEGTQPDTTEVPDGETPGEEGDATPNETNGTGEGQTQTGGAAGPNGENPEAGPGGTTPSPANGGGGTTTTPGTTPGTTGTTTPGGGGTTTTTRPTPPSSSTTTTPSTTTTTRPTTTTTRPVDVCPNLPGDQATVPPGMEIRDGICKEIPPRG